MELNVGDTYSCLTVVRCTNPNEWGRKMYLFKCVCDKEIEAYGVKVRNKEIKSCGCAKYRRGARKGIVNRRDFNIYDKQIIFGLSSPSSVHKIIQSTPWR